LLRDASAEQSRRGCADLRKTFPRAPDRANEITIPAHPFFSTQLITLRGRSLIKTDQRKNLRIEFFPRKNIFRIRCGAISPGAISPLAMRADRVAELSATDVFSGERCLFNFEHVAIPPLSILR
jgi:hypothetical protein